MSLKQLSARATLALCLVLLSVLLGACGGAAGDEDVLVGCRLNSDCPTGEACVEGECVEGGPCVGEDCPCATNADCTAGEACDGETGECFEVECDAGSGCVAGEVCAAGRCVADESADRDFDSIVDVDDNCPEVVNSNQEDHDDDGVGDACDDDDDNDTVPDEDDNCPFNSNIDQSDEDGDGIGDRCEGDEDGDGVVDGDDNCPGAENVDQADNDGDGRGDVCDDDDDDDGRSDVVDNCPLIANTSQADADGDGVGNACDDDVVGTSVRGRVDASARRGADPALALVRVSGVERPALPDSDGGFVFDDALPDGGRFAVRVEMDGFLPFIDEFTAPANVESVDVGALVLIPAPTEPQPRASLRGTARVAGGEDHSGVIVSARVDGVTVATAVTGLDGGYAIPADRLSHALNFSLAGLTSVDLLVTWSDERERFEVDGEALADTLVTLQPLRAASLSGLLSSPVEGQDFAGAVVTLVDGEGRRRVPVDSDGRFELAELATGLYGFEVDLAGHEPVRRFETLVSGVNDLGVVELEPVEVALSGRVVTPVDGVDVGLEGVALRLRREGRLVASTTSDEHGEFVFRASPVSHTLSLAKVNFLPQGFEVSFEGGRFIIGEEALEPQNPLTMVRAPESDADFDGVMDVLDNCPADFNVDQGDADGDGAGDACDADADGDGMFNGLDNCPLSSNPMQEDAEGLGRGVACSLGSAARPIQVGCGVRRQRLDTRERVDELQGRCGGAGAPEVVYKLGINPGESWSVQVEAEFSHVMYLIDEQGREVDCVTGGRALFGGDQLPSGHYRLVVDGLGRGDAGALDVSMASEQACLAPLSTTAQDFNVGGAPTAAVMGDVNGDGLLDLAVANSADNNVSVLLGDGGGDFGPQQVFGVGLEPGALVMGDVNGDGFLDLAVANSANNNVSVLLGDGGGGFGPQQVFGVGARPVSMALGDLNRDGLLDLVTSNRDSFNVSVLLGDGDGGFGLEQRFSAGVTPQALVMGDVNGDGLLDLAVANSGNLTVSVLLGDGEGGFGARQIFGAGAGLGSMVMGDVNGDGLLDLAVANSGNLAVSVLLGSGEGGFGSQQTFEVGIDPASVVLGDVNGDGLLDLATANPVSGSVSVLLGDGEGGFGARQVFEVAAGPASAVMGDVNGDGLLDIATVNPSSNSVSVLFSEEPIVLAPQQSFSVGNGPEEVTLGDVNEDGFLDLVTPNVNENTVSVLLSDQAGGFAPHTTFAVGAEPKSAALGDVNSDGLLDIATANRGSDDVSLLLGDGEGGFAPQRTFNVGDAPRMVKLEDINGDGLVDLVAVNRDSFDVSVLLGDGEGGFAPQQTFDVGVSPRSVVVGDVNSDGFPDLATANGSDDNVSVLLGDGEGGFAVQELLEVGRFPFAVTMGDANGDGRQDIVAANGSDGNVSVLLGDGEGGFEPQLVFEVGLSPRSVALQDINGDGHQDIVAANGSDGNVSVLLGDGDGEFEAQRTFGAGERVRSASVGDVNGDGLPDIVIANRPRVNSRDSVLVLASRTFVDAATRKLQAALPPCPSTSLSFDEGGSLVSDLLGCRIDRMSLELALPPDSQGALSLVSPLAHEVELFSWSDRGGFADRLRPEVLAPLARFESHSLAGLWALNASGFVIDGGQMVVNTYPEDPFAAETLAEACDAEVDQVTDPDFVCRLDVGSLEGASLDDDEDEDVFLLQGDFGGAFIQGQTIHVIVETAPGAPLSVDLRAFRAAAPLDVALQIAPGLWALSFTIPPGYSRRYFAVHVSGRGVVNLDYDILVD